MRLKPAIIGVLLLLGLCVLATATTALAYSAAGALACPLCYGFESAGSNVFIDKAAAPSTREAAVTAVREGRARVRSFYGTVISTPRIMICATDSCYLKLGGRSRGMALLDIGLFIAPGEASAVILAHELSHIELHARLGIVGTMRRDIPQWFDEGVAVVVSDDARYLTAMKTGDRCLLSSDETLPTKRADWVERADHDDLYKKAACRVSRWMTEHGGPQAVVSLIDAVARRKDFAQAYR